MQKYYSRICWNSKRWIFPSGEATQLEKNSYVTEAGFGQEEWLFCFPWLIDGYHYAFLQPVSFSFKNVTGKTVQILLFTIGPDRLRFYAAEINNCQILTAEQSEEALNFYSGKGWLNEMKEQVISVGGDVTKLDAEAISIFNVRFRPSDVDFYDPPRVARESDKINSLNRYRLYPAEENVVITQWRRRGGSTIVPTLHTITRSGQPAVTYDPIEKLMQAQLFVLLKARFGDHNVIMEADFVDITIKLGTKRIFVELKTDPDARMAIRKALGQILEYAYYPDARCEETELVIVAPGPITKSVSGYLETLRSRFGIPVKYCRFSLGSGLPEEFAKLA